MSVYFECPYCQQIVPVKGETVYLTNCLSLTCPECGQESMVHLLPTRIIVGDGKPLSQTEVAARLAERLGKDWVTLSGG